MSVAAGGALVAVSPAPAQDTCYRVVDLGILGFVPTIDHIFAINNANQAVFTANVAGKKHAMLYLPVAAYDLAAGVHDLHTLAGAEITGDQSVAHDINSAGIVVGWAKIGSDRRAFVWRLDTDEFFDLGTFASGDTSEAWAISDDTPEPWIAGKGEIDGPCDCISGSVSLSAGFALKLTPLPPDLTTAAELQRDLGIDCENIMAASDINNGPQPTVAGFSFFGGGLCIFNLNGTALYWANPMPPAALNGVALPLLPAGLGSEARGVSNLEAFSGFAITSDDEARAAYWDAVGGPIVNLGSLVPGEQTWGWRMNNNAPPRAGSSRLSVPPARWARVCSGSAQATVIWWPVGRLPTSMTLSRTVRMNGLFARLTTSMTMAGLLGWARLQDKSTRSFWPR